MNLERFRDSPAGRLEKVGLVREASGRQRNRAYLAEEVVRIVE